MTKQTANATEYEITFWEGRPTSTDPRGWYVNARDRDGNILDVWGPFDSKAQAQAA